VIHNLLTGGDEAGGEWQGGNEPSPAGVAVALVGQVLGSRDRDRDRRQLLAGGHAAARPVARRASCKRRPQRIYVSISKIAIRQCVASPCVFELAREAAMENSPATTAILAAAQASRATSSAGAAEPTETLATPIFILSLAGRRFNVCICRHIWAHVRVALVGRLR
jgi:hypothetical protein